MNDKPQHEKQLTPKSIIWSELLIDILNKHDERNFDGLEYSVNSLLSLSGVRNSKESAKFIARAYKIHGDWDDSSKKSIRLKLFGRLDSIWPAIENELKHGLKAVGAKYYDKSAYHHTCWWMYYSGLNLFNEDRMRGAIKRYLCYFLALWHIFCEHLIKTGGYVQAVKCTYFLFQGAKYAHTGKQYQLGGKYLAMYWHISQKYNFPVYMF